MATRSRILAWRIPWTGEPEGYSPQGCKELDTTEATQHVRQKSRSLNLSLLGRGHVSDLGPADELNGRNSVTSKVILLDMDSGRYGACQSLAGKRGQLLSRDGVLLGDYVGSV